MSQTVEGRNETQAGVRKIVLAITFGLLCSTQTGLIAADANIKGNSAGSGHAAASRHHVPTGVAANQIMHRRDAHACIRKTKSHSVSNAAGAQAAPKALTGELATADIEDLILALRWKDALTVIDFNMRSDPNNASLWLKRAYADIGLDRSQQAIDDCKHVLDDPQLKAKAFCLTGLAYRSLKKYQDALVAFDQAIKADPRQPLSYYGHAITQANLNNNKEAIQDFTQAISREDDRDSQAEALVGRARSEVALEQFSAALSDLDRAIEYQPEYAEAYESRAEVQFQLGRTELCMIDAMRATELAPKSPGAWYWRGCAAGILNRHKEALDAFNTSIELDDKSAQSYIYRGLVWVNLAQFDRAVQDAETALSLIGPDYGAYRTRAMAESKLGQYDKALADLAEMAKLEPNKAWTYVLRADVLLAKEEFSKALDDCEKALKLDPDVYVWEYKARALEGLQRYSEAVQVCDKQIAAAPRSGDAFVLRARLNLDRHNLAACLNDVDRALTFDPNWDYAHELRAIALGSRDEWAAVVKECDAYLNLNPGRPSMLRRRAIAYSNLKQFDKSKIDIDAAIRLDPTAYNYAARGDMALDEQKFDAALADANKAVELDPKLSYAYFVRGAAYGKLGKKELCEKDLTQAIALEKEPYEAQSALAYFTMQLGDLNKAVDAYTKAIELQPADPMGYTWRADAYNKLGQYEKAIEDCNKAIELESGLGLAYEKRATAYEKLGKTSEAQADRGHLEELAKK